MITTHNGYEALKPEEFDIWAGKRPRQYLHGVWKLWRVKQGSEGDVSGKNFDWWEQKFASGASDQIVPIGWHIDYSRSIKDMHPLSEAGMYGLELTLDREPAGRRVILHFDNVVRICEVYLDGKKVGGAYLPGKKRIPPRKKPARKHPSSRIFRN